MIKTEIGNSAIELIIGDITELTVDAIVNAANSTLKMGGGVAGAILEKGGYSIQRECDKIGRISVGTAVITSSGNLNAKFIIHAVGPRMGEGDEDEKLLNATLNSLKIAEQNAIQTIAFPAISTGIFGYPIDRCASIMLNTTAGYIKSRNIIKKVIFCLYDSRSFKIFQHELEKI